MNVPDPVELDDPRRYLQRTLKDDVPTEICANVALNGPSNVAFRAVDVLRSTSTHDWSLEWDELFDLKVFPTPVHVAAIEIVPPSPSVQVLASQSNVVNAMSVDARSTDVSLLTVTLPVFSAQPEES